MNKKESTWLDLYNCLYFIASTSKEVESLESSIFDPFEELDTALYNGLHNRNLEFYQNAGWIDESQKAELLKFKDYVEKIENKYWNKDDFDINEDWSLARQWANSLLCLLNEKKRGWDFRGGKIFFLD